MINYFISKLKLHRDREERYYMHDKELTIGRLGGQ